MSKPKYDRGRLEQIRRSATAAMAVLSKAARDEDQALGRLLAAEDALKRKRSERVYSRDEARHEQALADLKADIARLTREHDAAIGNQKEAKAAQQEAQSLLLACENYSKGL